jgi:hypothetical protein
LRGDCVGGTQYKCGSEAQKVKKALYDRFVRYRDDSTLDQILRALRRPGLVFSK